MSKFVKSHAMNAITLYNLDSYSILKGPRQINTIDEDFVIFNDIKGIPIYTEPTRMQNTVLSICLNGYTRIMVNMQEYYVAPGSVLLVMPDQILQSLEISDDYECACIALSKKFGDEVFSKLKVMVPLFFYAQEYPCLNLEEYEVKRAMSYYDMLWERSSLEENGYVKEIIVSLLVSMFYELYDVYRARMPRAIVGKNRKSILFDHFMKALSEDYKKERSVDFYARKLFLTAKHLSSVVKEVSGRTAGQWIESFVIYEAKTLLKSSEKNIQEISDELNFTNQSFFGKYFKNCTGMSPKEYRAQ